MVKKFLYKAVVLSSFMFVLSVATNASATSISTSAEVVGNITVSVTTPLDFGQFTVGSSGGSVTFPAGGLVSGTGDVVHLGSEVGGMVSLDTSGATSGETVTVTVGTGTLSDGSGNSMTVVGDCMGPSGSSGTGSCTFTSGGGTDLVDIGGTLAVSANQPAGTYTGTLEVTAAF